MQIAASRSKAHLGGTDHGLLKDLHDEYYATLSTETLNTLCQQAMADPMSRPPAQSDILPNLVAVLGVQVTLCGPVPCRAFVSRVVSFPTISFSV
jgi:hypothetical protein